MAKPKPIAIAASSYVSKAERARREYKKARAALLRRISRARKAGYDVSGFTVPKIPKRITGGSVRALKKLSQAFTKYKKQHPPILPPPINLLSIDDILYDRVIELIEEGKRYEDVQKSIQERVRHRAREAEDEYDNNGFYTDENVKRAAIQNLEENFEEIYARLEKFIYDSAFGFYGDLEELKDIVKLTVRKGLNYNDLTVEEKMEYGNALTGMTEFNEEW